MVYGVSANFGMSALGLQGNGSGGALPAFSMFGGTNSLVSVDALQEFRIQTSTYAPEFGRTPGGQISVATRSGTNQFHGTLFDYFRNEVLDANDWFGNSNDLAKPEERQNDFGGTFSGPILKDRTFFFFSYEGLRLRLPRVEESTVPDLSARQSAQATLQPFLNAYPLPNPNKPDVGNGIAPFNASFSNSGTLDAYSLRADHKLSQKLSLFGRYNYSPSEILVRGDGGHSLSTLSPTRNVIQTATVGTAWNISPTKANDLRFNYSRANASTSFRLDNFGGAVPLASLPIPSAYSSQNAFFLLGVDSLKDGALGQGNGGKNLQQQFNTIDDLSVQQGSHSLKFGIDYRRLTPFYGPELYVQQATFPDVPAVEAGNLGFATIIGLRHSTLLFQNLGVFAQDTWRIIPRLTLTYGLRWDIDFSPSSIDGPNILAVTGFDLNNLSTLTIGPPGTPPFSTRYGNVAPRFGLAYQLSPRQDWQSVLRGGFGVFYDLATQEAGSFLSSSYPFGALKAVRGGAFPLDSASAGPPPITLASLQSGILSAFDPHLQLPYTLEWNIAFEQSLGRRQSISASYVGAAGRRLIQSTFVVAPNPDFSLGYLVTNKASSDYDALQLQFQRRLSHGFQALASFTWSHSIDTGSAGSAFGSVANALVPTLNQNANRGSSDFDIRTAVSAAITYDVPTPKINAFMRAGLRGWSLQTIIQARSAPPVDIADASFSFFKGFFFGEVRPDLVSGQPLFLHGSQFPGGKALNQAAFTDPPVDPNTGFPLRQGNVSRNFLRGFGATQVDLAVHRDFPLRELMKLQIRAEMFNVLNHPNFGPPNGQFGVGGFGVSGQMLGQSLNGGSLGSNLGGGAFDPLYQIGGPRSIQFALKLFF